MDTRINVLAVLGLGVMVAGCPQPPPGGEPPAGGATGPVGGEGVVGVQSGPVWDFDLSVMHPQVTQEEVKQGDHVVLTSEVKGECNGHLRIDVIAREDGPGTPDGGAPPLTSVDLEAVGPFSIAVPAGRAVALGGCCDNDRDGLIVPGVDSFIAPVAVDLEKGTEGLTLMLGPVQAPGQGVEAPGTAATADGAAPVPPPPPPPDGGTAGSGTGPHPDKRGGATKHPDKRGGAGG